MLHAPPLPHTSAVSNVDDASAAYFAAAVHDVTRTITEKCEVRFILRHWIQQQRRL